MKDLERFDNYLAGLDPVSRKALEKVLKQVEKMVPDAKRSISYGMPALKLDRPLIAVGATANHCALYPLSGTVLESLRKDLDGYEISKGTLRFAAAKGLPSTIIQMVVQAKIKELASEKSSPKKKK